LSHIKGWFLKLFFHSPRRMPFGRPATATRILKSATRTCLGAFTRRKNQRTTSHKQADRTEAFHSRCSVNSWIQIAVCNSRNAVSFSSARATNRFPSPRCGSAIESDRQRQIVHYPSACLYCHQRIRRVLALALEPCRLPQS